MCAVVVCISILEKSLLQWLVSCKALLTFLLNSEMLILRTHTHRDNNITLVKLSLFSFSRKRRCPGSFLSRRQDSMCVCHQAPRSPC